MIGPEGERGGSSPKGEPQDRQRGEIKGSGAGKEVPKPHIRRGEGFEG